MKAVIPLFANRKRRIGERGFTLLEMVIASMVLMVGIVGVMSLLGVAVARTAGTSDQATRTAEYAQDKMEQLMALEFLDAQSDVTQYPTVSTGGTGLTAGGSVTTITTGFVDYGPDSNGKFYTSNTATQIGTAYYTRQWSIVDTSALLKTLTVVVKPPSGMTAPPILLVSQKQKY